MADNERFRYLFKQYAVKEAVEQEKGELFTLLESGAYDDLLLELIDEQWNGEIPEWIRSNDAQKAEENFEAIMSRVKVKKLGFVKRIAVAAAIIFVIAAVMVGIITNNHKATQPPVATTHDIQAPKETRAVITLADGTKVYLDSVGTGTLATQANITVEKSTDGKIVYNATNGIAKEIAYNTLTNPRGSKVIDMQLSDGSHVWLNAGSSVKYPVAFVGNERKVEITGEAYFEVAHDAKHPFIVSKGNTNVTVLGTHFNVNAYDDEETLKVTLLEGSVKVDAANNGVLIKPGEQAQVNGGNAIGIVVNRNIDVDEVMAWKNGRFELNGNVQGIMREISRWYDVDIEYVGNVTNRKFGGTLSRAENVSKVLKYLELTGSIHFKIEGRKITVMP